MHLLFALVVLSQVKVAEPQAAVMRSKAWAPPVTWVEQGVTKQASLSIELVAEPGPPTAATAAAITAFDPAAHIVFERPSMRLWQVTNPAATLAHVAQLLPVLHDLPSTASRLRVPVGVVCPGKNVSDIRGLEVLAYLGAHPDCLPNFWYRPTTK